MKNISNLITCIRNAKNAKLNSVIWSINKNTKITNIEQVLIILRNNGVIRSFSYDTIKLNVNIIIYLKYDQTGNSCIRSIFNVSKPSRILYIITKSLWQPQSTTGFYVLSTSYGILTDMDARRYNVGGCILFGIT